MFEGDERLIAAQHIPFSSSIALPAQETEDTGHGDSGAY